MSESVGDRRGTEEGGDVGRKRMISSSRPGEIARGDLGGGVVESGSGEYASSVAGLEEISLVVGKGSDGSGGRGDKDSEGIVVPVVPRLSSDRSKDDTEEEDGRGSGGGDWDGEGKIEGATAIIARVAGSGAELQADVAAAMQRVWTRRIPSYATITWKQEIDPMAPIALRSNAKTQSLGAVRSIPLVGLLPKAKEAAKASFKQARMHVDGGESLVGAFLVTVSLGGSDATSSRVARDLQSALHTPMACVEYQWSNDTNTISSSGEERRREGSRFLFSREIDTSASLPIDDSISSSTETEMVGCLPSPSAAEAVNRQRSICAAPWHPEYGLRRGFMAGASGAVAVVTLWCPVRQKKSKDMEEKRKRFPTSHSPSNSLLFVPLLVCCVAEEGKDGVRYDVMSPSSSHIPVRVLGTVRVKESIRGGASGSGGGAGTSSRGEKGRSERKRGGKGGGKEEGKRVIGECLLREEGVVTLAAKFSPLHHAPLPSPRQSQGRGRTRTSSSGWWGAGSGEEGGSGSGGAYVVGGGSGRRESVDSRGSIGRGSRGGESRGIVLEEVAPGAVELGKLLGLDDVTASIALSALSGPPPPSSSTYLLPGSCMVALLPPRWGVVKRQKTLVFSQRPSDVAVSSLSWSEEASASASARASGKGLRKAALASTERDPLLFALDKAQKEGNANVIRSEHQPWIFQSRVVGFGAYLSPNPLERLTNSAPLKAAIHSAVPHLLHSSEDATLRDSRTSSASPSPPGSPTLRDSARSSDDDLSASGPTSSSKPTKGKSDEEEERMGEGSESKKVAASVAPPTTKPITSKPIPSPAPTPRMGRVTGLVDLARGRTVLKQWSGKGRGGGGEGDGGDGGEDGGRDRMVGLPSLGSFALCPAEPSVQGLKSAFVESAAPLLQAKHRPVLRVDEIEPRSLTPTTDAAGRPLSRSAAVSSQFHPLGCFVAEARCPISPIQALALFVARVEVISAEAARLRAQPLPSPPPHSPSMPHSSSSSWNPFRRLRAAAVSPAPTPVSSTTPTPNAVSAPSPTFADD